MERIINSKYKVLIIILCGLLSIGGSMAFLNKSLGIFNNVFSGTREKVNVAVVEKEDNELKQYETGQGLSYVSLTNETAVYKEVAIKNVNLESYPTGDTFVRMRVVPMFVYNSGDEHEGQVVPIDMSLLEIKSLEKNDSLGNWVIINNSNEKYYYYSDALEPNQITDFIEFEVKYNGTLVENTHLQLQVLTEGISSNVENDGDKWRFVQQAWGLSTEDINLISNAAVLA